MLIFNNYNISESYMMLIQETIRKFDLSVLAKQFTFVCLLDLLLYQYSCLTNQCDLVFGQDMLISF